MSRLCPGPGGQAFKTISKIAFLRAIALRIELIILIDGGGSSNHGRYLKQEILDRQPQHALSLKIQGHLVGNVTFMAFIIINFMLKCVLPLI